VSAIDDIPTDVVERPHAVKVEPAVMRWHADRTGRHNDVWPVVVVLHKDAETSSYLDYYSTLTPTSTPQELSGFIHRENLLPLMEEEGVLEIREGNHRCNKCSSDMRRYLDLDKEVSEIYGLYLSYMGGYGSDPLGDLTCYSFSICENCLAALFEMFDKPPTEENIPFGPKVRHTCGC
jgi:hypothetical protein